MLVESNGFHVTSLAPAGEIWVKPRVARLFVIASPRLARNRSGEAGRSQMGSSCVGCTGEVPRLSIRVTFAGNAVDFPVAGGVGIPRTSEESKTHLRRNARLGAKWCPVPF